MSGFDFAVAQEWEGTTGVLIMQLALPIGLRCRGAFEEGLSVSNLVRFELFRPGSR